MTFVDAFFAKGKRVLLVDNDKQGDCSRGMNRRTQEGAGIDKIMVDKKPDMASLIQKTDYENLDVITANLNLNLFWIFTEMIANIL